MQLAGDILGSADMALPSSAVTFGRTLARSSLGSGANFNASAVLAHHQDYEIQVIASTFSACSVLAAICAIYWFCMMRRNFRRDLILLLICGDFWKSLWLLIFSSISLARGAVHTSSPFCQASGFFLQLGFEACDCAILLMSLHLCLQMFPPRHSCLENDGIYRIRHYVMAAWLIVPAFMASLAFINPVSAYVSQAGFCSLPIRPFWYRLALSWIPRYLVWVYVMFVAVRIYTHVGYEFKVFGGEKDGSTGPNTGNTPTELTHMSVPMQRDQSTPADAARREDHVLEDDSVEPDAAPFASPTGNSTANAQATQLENLRTQSRSDSIVAFARPNLENFEWDLAGAASAPRSKSNPASCSGGQRWITELGAAEDSASLHASAPVRPNGSVSSMTSKKSSATHSAHDRSSSGLGTITEHRTPAAPSIANPQNLATEAMQERRRAIQRQLRLLFIYPVVYILLWIIPFVAHALSYSDHFAQHPIFAISALSTFFQTIMGACDVFIFSWREKPWRHIPGSDGSFFGSLCFWRFAFRLESRGEQRLNSTAPNHALAMAQEKSDPFSPSSPSAPFFPPNHHPFPRWSSTVLPTSFRSEGAPMSPPFFSHRRAYSDRRALEAERARERLALERAEWAQRHQPHAAAARRGSEMGALQRQEQQQEHQLPETPLASPTRKEWWDRDKSIFEESFDD